MSNSEINPKNPDPAEVQIALDGIETATQDAQRALAPVSDDEIRQYLIKHCPESVDRNAWEKFIRHKVTRGVALLAAGTILWSANKNYTLDYGHEAGEAYSRQEYLDAALKGLHVVAFGSFWAEKTADIAVGFLETFDSMLLKLLPPEKKSVMEAGLQTLLHQYPQIAGMWLMLNQAMSGTAFLAGGVAMHDPKQLSTAVGRVLGFHGATDMQNLNYRAARTQGQDQSEWVQRWSEKIHRYIPEFVQNMDPNLIKLLSTAEVMSPHVIKYMGKHGLDFTHAGDPSFQASVGYGAMMLYLTLAQVGAGKDEKLIASVQQSLDRMQEEIVTIAARRGARRGKLEESLTIAAKTCFEAIAEAKVLPQEVEQEFSKLLLRHAQNVYNAAAQERDPEARPFTVPQVMVHGQHASCLSSGLLKSYYQLARDVGVSKMEVVRNQALGPHEEHITLRFANAQALPEMTALLPNLTMWERERLWVAPTGEDSGHDNPPIIETRKPDGEIAWELSRSTLQLLSKAIHAQHSVLRA